LAKGPFPLPAAIISLGEPPVVEQGEGSVRRVRGIPLQNIESITFMTLDQLDPKAS
jgi:hypothetical protein